MSGDVRLQEAYISSRTQETDLTMITTSSQVCSKLPYLDCLDVFGPPEINICRNGLLHVQVVMQIRSYSV